METPVNVNEMSRKQIYAYFRKHDDSHLWPIRNKFNVTERAIRKNRKEENYFGEKREGLELFLSLENHCSEIVNNEKNW